MNSYIKRKTQEEINCAGHIINKQGGNKMNQQVKIKVQLMEVATGKQVGWVRALTDTGYRKTTEYDKARTFVRQAEAEYACDYVCKCTDGRIVGLFCYL